MKRKQEVLYERQKSRELLCMRIYKPGAEKKARKTFFLLCVCVCQKPECEADDLAVRLKMLWKCVCAGVCWPAGSATGCPRCERLEKWSEWSRMKQLAHPPLSMTQRKGRREGRRGSEGGEGWGGGEVRKEGEKIRNRQSMRERRENKDRKCEKGKGEGGGNLKK